MKFIVFAIFTLVLTETITGKSIKETKENAAPTTPVCHDENDPSKVVPCVDTPGPQQPNSTTSSTTTTTPATTTTSTTIAPNTTTHAPPTPPITTSTSTPITTPNSTTTTPTAAPPAPTESPSHKTDRKFDSFSFIAGIVMAAGLMAIGLVAFKFYEARRDRNYHTI